MTKEEIIDELTRLLIKQKNCGYQKKRKKSGSVSLPVRYGTRNFRDETDLVFCAALVLDVFIITEIYEGN